MSIEINQKINQGDYDRPGLMIKKKKIEEMLNKEIEQHPEQKQQILEENKISIIRLGTIIYKLDLEDEQNDFLEKYVYPLGLDKFMESSEIIFFVGQQKYENKEYKSANNLFYESMVINKHNYKARNFSLQILQRFGVINLVLLLHFLKFIYEIKEDYYLTHFNLAKVYDRMKDYKNAEIHYNIAIKLQPKNFYCIFKPYAELLIMLKKYQQCIDLLIKYIDKTKNDIQLKFDFYIQLSFCEFKNNQFDKSLEYAQICIGLFPKHYLGHFLKSQCLESQGQHQVAAILMSRSINIKKITQSQQQNQSGEKKIQYGFEDIFYRDQDLYFLLGEIYWNLRSYPEALEYYSKSLEIDRKQCHPYYPITVIYLKQKQYDLFLNIYEQQIIYSKQLNMQSFLNFLEEDNNNLEFDVIRIESFMQNILFGNIYSLELISKIYDLIINNLADTLPIDQSFSNHNNKNNNEIQTRKELQNEIFCVLSEKYMRNTQSLLLLLAYHKNIKIYIQCLSEYFILDLLID